MTCRYGLKIQGRVQGVGFRPFVYRLAQELGLSGEVCNSPQGVELQIQGEQPALALFLKRLQSDLPPQAHIEQIQRRELTPLDEGGVFRIVPSEQTGPAQAVVLPDLATCEDCLSEVFDPKDRRFGYAFTNCTNCGPRFSIIEDLPYDRSQTSMKGFEMCPACLAEYEDPQNRRFHAQPNACPDCGPQVSLVGLKGEALAQGPAALAQAGEALKGGQVLALKGIGGFLLLARADQNERLTRLRQDKHRPKKPFALMVPNLRWARRVARVDETEAELLNSPAAPIVLLKRSASAAQWIAPEVAPGAPELGVMLPYSPLHHLLLRDLDLPLVATSGNLAGEPICTELDEALEKLGHLVDLYLDHNRPIVRPLEDSIQRVIDHAPQTLRLARGLAPLVLPSATPLPPALALGGQQKAAVALGLGHQAILGAYLGDLDNLRAQEGFKQACADLPRLYQSEPKRLLHDHHPAYFSSRWAQAETLPSQGLSHHRAHLWALMAESGETGEVLGFSWDGTGLGDDQKIWGGEVFAGPPQDLKRIAHLPPFKLPGGEAAIKNPLRIAYALWHQIAGVEVFKRPEAFCLPPLPPHWAGLPQILEKNLNCPSTSSMGRLFDGVAAWLGLCGQVSYEGEAAIELERAALKASAPAEAVPGEPMDWPGLLESLRQARLAGAPLELCALQFHNQLVRWIFQLAEKRTESTLLLSGGCFQNRLLCQAALDALKPLGRRVHLHRLTPPNDGALALGQLFGAALELKQGTL